MSADDLRKDTQNNSALDLKDTGECLRDSSMNSAAETLVQDILLEAEQDVYQESEDQEEEFYDVATGLENCKLDEESSECQSETKQLNSSNDEDSAKSRSCVNDSSLTDDEIEVICRYSSPNVATDFKKELEAANDTKSKHDEKFLIDNIGNMPKLSPEQSTFESPCQNGESDVLLPSQIMYLPPECYMPSSDFPTTVKDQAYFGPSTMYQGFPPGDIYPPHLLESEVLQHQEMVQAQAQIQAHTCEQIENGYLAYSNGEPPSHMYSNCEPPLPHSPYLYSNGQYPLAGLCDIGPCDYSGDMSGFVYPSIYVSSSGLMTVLLKNDTSVEMTLDRTVRVVSHKTKMAVASSSRGNMSILYHPTVKLYQDGNVTHVQINEVKAKMATDDIWFANEISSFKFDANLIEPATPTYRDMSKDDSVNLLFSADKYGENLVPQCLEAASVAEYENLPKGGVQVRINGVKITQSSRGDVVVVTGPKYLKLSPNNGLIRINTQYIEVTVEKDSNTRIRRGGHLLNAFNGRVMLSNGRIEAGFDEHSRLKVMSLPGRSPLEIGVRRTRRQAGPPRRKTNTMIGEAY